MLMSLILTGLTKISLFAFSHGKSISAGLAIGQSIGKWVRLSEQDENKNFGINISRHERK